MANHWSEGVLFLAIGVVSLMLTLVPIPIGWQPLWPFILVVYWGSKRPFNGIMELSMLLGLCWDSLIAAPLGTTAIGLLVCAYLVRLFQRALQGWLMIKKIGFYSGLIVLFYVIDVSIQFYFQTIMAPRSLWLPCIITLGLMPVCFALLTWLVPQTNGLTRST